MSKHRQWYGDQGQGSYQERTIRFLDDVTFGPHKSLTIKINVDFLKTQPRYAAKVPLPLALDSDAALNLDLLWRSATGINPDATNRIKRNFEGLCNKVGLARPTAGKLSDAFNKLIDQVNRHRARIGDDTLLQVTAKPNKPELIIITERSRMPKADPRLHDDVAY